MDIVAASANPILERSKLIECPIADYTADQKSLVRTGAGALQS